MARKKCPFKVSVRDGQAPVVRRQVKTSGGHQRASGPENEAIEPANPQNGVATHSFFIKKDPKMTRETSFWFKSLWRSQFLAWRSPKLSDLSFLESRETFLLVLKFLEKAVMFL